MGIRADSYSSVAAVEALTKFLLQGNSNFNSTTTPLKTEVESFIDESSGILNLALMDHGFAATSIIANSTAKLACDNWVRTWAVAMVELTSPAGGMGGGKNSRMDVLKEMNGDAKEFADKYAKAFKQLGISQAYSDGDQIVFTGQNLYTDRSDPTDSSLEKPLFRRNQFDNI